MNFKNYAGEFEKLDKMHGLSDIVLNELRQSIGDGGLLICTIGYTGTKDFDSHVRGRLKKHGINYRSKQLNVGDEVRDKYRIVDEDAEKFKTDAEVLLFFDGIIESGGTIIGANIWGLENSSILGVKKIFSLTIKDNKGYSNFSFLPDFLRETDYTGPIESIKRNAPQKFSELGEKTNLLSSENPYNHQLFDIFKYQRMQQKGKAPIPDIITGDRVFVKAPLLVRVKKYISMIW